MAKEKTKVVYSTLVNDQIYTNYVEPKDRRNDMPPVTGSVVIKGGFGLADKQTFVTSQGAATEVDDDELAMLEANSEFRAHRDRGYIKVEDRKKPVEKVTPAMAQDDESKPLTENDYTDPNGPAPPKTGAPTDEE